MARLIDSVIGHRDVWTGLRQQMEAEKLPHALAFSGPAGIGKRRVAWAFAQALLCDSTQAPCGECPSCLRVAGGQSESVLYVEPSKNTIKLEAAREILAFLNLRRLGRARVVLIDGAQNLNPQAANALLKIIEEPPAQTYFVLIVSAWSQLLPTLRSRLQARHFNPLSEAEIQKLETEPVPTWMLRSARGSFSQLEAFRDPQSDEIRKLTLGLLAGALAGQREGLEHLLEHSKDREVAGRAIAFLQQLLRDWSVLGTGELLHADLESSLAALPPLPSEQRLALWRKAHQLEQDLNAHVDRFLLFENFFRSVPGI